MLGLLLSRSWLLLIMFGWGFLMGLFGYENLSVFTMALCGTVGLVKLCLVLISYLYK